MSFIAVCDKCNLRKEYSYPHGEALRRAIDDEWLIKNDEKMCGNCRLMAVMTDPEIWYDDEIETVDGSDIDRVTKELIERGGADAVLGRFLSDKVAEYFATVDPVSCAND